jgi:preprotein translocase subunit SecE
VGSNPTAPANNYIIMAKVVDYIKESYDELMNKVTWPTWAELQNSAIVVSIASLIIAMVVFLMDLTFKNGLELFYRSF